MQLKQIATKQNIAKRNIFCMDQSQSDEKDGTRFCGHRKLTDLDLNADFQ